MAKTTAPTADASLGAGLPALLSQPQAWRLLGIHEATWHRWKAAGKLPPAVPRPGQPKYRKKDILKLLGEGL